MRIISCLFFLLLSSYTFGLSLPDDTVQAVSGETVLRAIYPESMKNKSKLYNKLWGEHYRKLYFKPITVQAITPETFSGGIDTTYQAEEFHGIILEDKQKQLYLLKPLGGSTSFLESSFFQEMYNKADFQDTYLDKFIGDAYTIINPYAFISADYLAKTSGLSSNNSRIFFIPAYTTNDTIADGSTIQNRLVYITDIPDINTRPNILSTEDMQQKVLTRSSYRVNQELYIRERIFDMLIGDWNKIPENWNWLAQSEKGDTIFSPIVIDRNHAFTKVDGILFKQMLNVLGLSFITNYDSEYKDLKKINKLGFTLDMALSNQSNEDVWIKQARFLKKQLNDKEIDKAFRLLPADIESEETELIKENLKKRRDNLEEIAKQYFRQLQYNPVIAATNQSDSIIVHYFSRDSLQISIYDTQTSQLTFDRKYNQEKTKEIWLYGLDGDDYFTVNGKASKEIPVYLITGEGDNDFDLTSGKKIRIYAHKKEKEKLKEVSYARKIISDNPEIHSYDYEKTKYHTTSFTPWGIYDSDNGISLGAFLTYTMYGFKRAPFTYRHRIGFNYLEGFMYQAIFPSYDGRKSFYIDAFLGNAKNFSNFFGFGNNTDGYKDERNNYNRVNTKEFTVSPSFHYDFSKEEKGIIFTSLELFKAKRSEGRFISEYYSNDHEIFETNYYLNTGVTFQSKKQVSSFLSKLESELTAGWIMNLQRRSRNFPYAEAKISLDMELTDRITWATMMKGKVLFNNKYEFFQAATTELRGFRDNRFIGQQSFYQYSDIRLDMGALKNPFTPLKYGVFGGVDYGRVWYPGEDSKKWHVSYGGGFWLTLINKITTKYSYFGSSDSFRFMFELGMGF